MLRRLVLMFALLIAGGGALLASALPAHAAADTVTVTPVGSFSSPVNMPILTLQLAAADSVPGNATAFTWTQTGLPTGLALNAATGAITGTPTITGVNTVVATAKVSAGTDAGLSGTATWTWTIAAATASPSASASTITVTPAVNRTNYVNLQTNIPPVHMRAADSAAAAATFTWTATGLPAGLVISTSGVITGSPTTAEIYDTTVTATEVTPDAGKTGTAIFRWTITGASPSMTASPTATPTGMTPTPAPSSTVIPVGGVVTGGGGSLGGGPSALLLATGAGLVLAGGGTGLYALRRRGN